MSDRELEGLAEKTNEDMDDDDDLIRSARSMRFGQYKSIALLVGVSLMLMLLSPVFNRYLESYQAVVVAPPESGRVKVITEDGMPRDKRVSSKLAPSLEVGTYLRKSNFAWDPTPVAEGEITSDPSIDDPARQPPTLLPRLLERYTSTWAGAVTDVSHRRLPTVGGRAGEQEVEYRMTIELEDGRSFEMVVPDSILPGGLSHLTAQRAAEALRGRLVGARIEKRPLTWEPVLVSPPRP